MTTILEQKTEKTKKNKAIFLDRDGVINHVLYHEGVNKPSSPWKFEEFQLYNGVEKPLEELRKMGFLLLIISNQPDISKGKIEEGMTEKVNKIIFEKLPIQDILICPHEDRHNCNCRKPKPGMIIELSKKWNVDIGKSFLIGDRWKDIEAGENAGCTSILLDKPYNKDTKAEYRTKDLQSAVELIKSISKI
jgi:D-glycero-D-manno-heptose 1,7-bisphosphate phosphatase